MAEAPACDRLQQSQHGYSELPWVIGKSRQFCRDFFVTITIGLGLARLDSIEIETCCPWGSRVPQPPCNKILDGTYRLSGDRSR
ncbi:hypothetical protein PCC6311_2226 [Synechococcus elongatus PCC 6311]|nr:hypothetical protein M744_05640 [Synechococcus elongatus UTEX 2973]UOW71970.1 hypothetical protein PCC7943_2228 [Synechococcus elongatus PCC 7943]UOW74689.1 hypothetical protein PCC6311_2226 [Synechococcus elongatus PCC 6311]UOW77410.1 hypothetical protein PCC6301pg_2228 [Synechococcus elongatus PCC 6301]